jgi:HEXXH motif-containing protein
MKASLNASTVTTLISPTGLNSIVRAVYVKEFQGTLIKLNGLKTKLTEEAPELVVNSGFGFAFNFIRGCESTIQRMVLGYPSCDYWVDVAWNLIERQAHVIMPELHILMHLESFNKFLLSAALLSERGSFKTVAWSDYNANVCLPGTSTYIHLHEQPSYQRLDIEVIDGKINSVQPSATSVNTLTWTRDSIPVIRQGIELNAVDSDLHLDGDTGLEYESPNLADIIKWQSSLEDALSWIEKVDKQLVEEMVFGVKTIIPVISSDPNKHISVTFGNAPGLVALSWTSDSSILVEALIHEYHHHKLYAIMNVDPLIIGSAHDEIYYSPWRTDPRPLYGIFHGVYVFHAVVKFWETFIKSKLVSLQEGHISQRIYTLRLQIIRGLDVLKEHGTFSKLGLSLLTAIEESILNVNLELVKVDHEVKYLIENRLSQHYDRWLRDNPGTLMQHSQVQVEPQSEVHASKLPDAIWERCLSALNISKINVNEMVNARYPNDMLLNAIVNIENRQVLDELEGELGRNNIDHSLGTALLLGHIQYVKGSFAEAANAYFACLRYSPSAYIWQCFSFALRNKGRLEESNTIVHNLGILADRKLPDSWVSADDPLEQVVGFIRSQVSEKK